MIPLYRTTRPEIAVNWLVKHFERVLVQQHPEFNDRLRIRFRADMVKGADVYFDRVPSQLIRWQERGGVLITGLRADPVKKVFGKHDAIVWSECPTRLKLLYRDLKDVTTVGVIRQRPDVLWKGYEEAIRTRRPDYPITKQLQRIKLLYQMRAFVDALPGFSPVGLARLLRALEGELPPSRALVSCADVGLAPDRTCSTL